MVLDSRSRVDSTATIDGNDVNSSSTNSSTNGIYTTVDVISPPTSTNSKIKKTSIGGWWQSLGLRTKTAIVSVAAITIPLLAIGGFTYYYVGQNIINTTRQAKSIRAQGMANRTALFMRERYGDIQTLANLPSLNNPKVQASISIAEQKVILDNYLKVSGIYDSIAVYALDGKLIVDAGTDPAPASAFKSGYFQDVLTTDKPTISQPEPSIVTKKVSIFVAAPVKDITTGKTIAIVRSRMPQSSLEEIYKDYIPVGEEYHLIESDGKIFIALEKEKIGLDIKDDFPNLISLIEKRGAGAVISIEKLSKTDKFVGYAPFSKLEGLPDLKWEAVISVSAEQELKPLQQLLLILVGATSAVGILAAVLAVVIARRATRPLLEATEAVVELGKGNLDTRLVVQGQDEMAQLGGNINLMAEQLQLSLKLRASEVQLAEIRGDISRLQGNEGLDKLLIGYLDTIRSEMKCDRAVIYEFDEEFAGQITRESMDRGWTSAFDAQLSDPCIPNMIIESYKQGRTVAITDVFNSGFAPKHLDLMHKLQIKSNLVVPIRQFNVLYGLLIVHKCQAQHAWQEEEITYLRQAGEQLGTAFNGVQLAIEKQNAAEQERQRSESIQRELITLLSDVEGAVSGDLTVRAQISAGEIGIVADFFNAIVESLREVVTQVKLATVEVNTSVNTNNESIRTLASDATLQSQQLDGVLQSVEQMTDSIQEVASNARQAADASNKAATTAETGSLAIAQSATSILQLRQTVAETTKKVKRLGEASQQISKVVVLIDQIALKTNMLAVNASIEAARAGEEGRGFAVVAEEVGALAAQSATATKEIARIVESIQQETTEVVESMEASTLQVVEGTNKVEDARKSLVQIVEVARQVNELFQGISIATTSQVQTSQSVKLVMENLSIQSQKSSETSREVAIALQETANVASKLQASVETFKVDAA